MDVLYVLPAVMGLQQCWATAVWHPLA